MNASLLIKIDDHQMEHRVHPKNSKFLCLPPIHLFALPKFRLAYMHH